MSVVQAPAVAQLEPTGDPEGFLRQWWSAYEGLFPRILDQLHRAGVIIQTWDPGTVPHETARAAQTALKRLADIHTATVRRVESLEVPGLGGLPVAVLAALSAVALIVAWSFREIESQGRILDMIEAGTITAEQAAALEGAAGPAPPLDVLGQVAGIGSSVVWLAVGALALWLMSRPRANPPLVVLNPPEDWGEPLSIDYTHHADGRQYRHHFREGAELEALADGSVRLYRPEDVALWEEFSPEEGA